MSKNTKTYKLWKWNAIFSTLAVAIVLVLQHYAIEFAYYYALGAVVLFGSGAFLFGAGEFVVGIVLPIALITVMSSPVVCGLENRGGNIWQNVWILGAIATILSILFTGAFWNDDEDKKESFVFRCTVSIPFIGVVLGALVALVIKKREQVCN